MYGSNASDGDDNDNDRETTFKITNTKLNVPTATPSTKDNANLTKQLNEGFKRPAYWNQYKTKIKTKEADNSLVGFYLDTFFQGVKTLYVLAFNNATVTVTVTIQLTIKIIKLKETVIENISSQE